jgi:3-dehydroquinate dehydratase-2
MKPILILNGPNLNLLGQREPEVYGRETLADVEALCGRAAREAGLSATCRQSNREYELIEWIQEARDSASAIVINPGAFTHTSVALLDALQAFAGPVIEVHISNIFRREPFRHHSYVSGRADAVIAGAGTQGYAFAIARAARLLGKGVNS